MTNHLRLSLAFLCLVSFAMLSCFSVEDDDIGAVATDDTVVASDLDFPSFEDSTDRVSTAVPSASTLRVISWNLRHEGWSGETAYSADAAQIWKNFGSSSTSPNGCDVAFFQEVMSSAAANGIAASLTTLSGVPWVAVMSPLIGRTTYKESYAVVYRTDRVSIVNWYVWTDTGDKFEREPMIVKVRDKTSGADFTFIDWHAIFGTNAERQAEIREIATVFSKVQFSDLTDHDVILLGDFNVSATSTWWNPLTSLSPTVGWKVNDPSTLNSSGAYVSAYDHFWFQSSYVTEYSSSGRDYVADPLDFVMDLSDHVPIWIKLYSTSDTD